MRPGSPLARHLGASPPATRDSRNSSPNSSPRGYGKIRRPSELAMRIGMLACDAQSPAMRSQAKHLRAALRFDRLPNPHPNTNPNPKPKPTPKPNPNPNPNPNPD